MMVAKQFDASHITYLHLCHRKLWIHHHGMRLEDNSADVHIGKQIGEQAYNRRDRRWKELSVGPVKIDHFDARLRLVREVKKSPKLEHVHIAQVKYYIYQLEKHGIPHARGLIEYPRHKRTTRINEADYMASEVEGWLREIEAIVTLETAPPAVRKSYCSKCAYYEFCFS